MNTNIQIRHTLLIGLLAITLLSACGPVTPVANKNNATPKSSNLDLEIITPQNVGRIQEIGRWGRGRIVDNALTPDGKILAILTTTGVIYYDPITLNEISTSAYPGLKTSFPDETITAIAFSPNGTSVAYATNDKYSHRQVVVLDINSGKNVGYVNHWVPSEQIRGIQFSPDGKYLALTSLVGGDVTICERDVLNIALYEIASNRLLYNHYYCMYAIVTSTFAPDDRLHIFIGYEQPYEYLVIETSTGNRIKRELYEFSYTGNIDNINRIYDVSHDGSTFAAVQFTDDGPIYQLLDAKTLDVVETTKKPVRFLPNPQFRWLDGRAETWELQTTKGELLCKFDISWGANMPTLFAPDGKTGFSLGVQELQRWDLSTCQAQKSVLIGAEQSDFTISPDGKTIAVQDYHNFYLQEARSGKTLLTLLKPHILGHGDVKFAFNPDGKRIYARLMRDDKSYQIAEIDTGTGRILRFLQYTDYFNLMAVPTNNRIVFWKNDQIEIWDIDADAQIALLPSSWGNKISPSKSEILLVKRNPLNAKEGQVSRIDLKTGRTIQTFPLEGIRDAAYIFEHLVFITLDIADDREKYAILNLDTGQLESQFEQPPDSQYGYQRLALTPDHVFMMFDNKQSPDYAGWIQMRSTNNLADVKIIGKLPTHSWYALDITPNQQILISNSTQYNSWNNQTLIQFWNAQTGELLAEMLVDEGADSSVSVSISPDGRFIALVGNGVVRLWGVPQK